MRTILKIVVPVDFSDCSLQALDEAVQFARPIGARLHLLHVVPALTGRSLSSEVGNTRELLRNTVMNEGQANLAALLPRLHGLEHETAVRTGRTSQAIVAYADEIDADLIIIATHGRSGIARMLIGSTTEEVVRRARCPVLTVRPERVAASGVCAADDATPAPGEDLRFRMLTHREDHPIRVRDAMRRDVLTVQPGTHVSHLIDLMIAHDVSGVPVVNEACELLGYVPESHLLVRSLAEFERHTGHSKEDNVSVEGFLKIQRQIHGKTAVEVMCPAQEVITVEESQPLAEAVRAMLTHHVSRMPVLRGRKVVGYLTRADVLRVVRHFTELREESLTDEEVSRLVRIAVNRSPEVNPSGLVVETVHGVVTIHGSVSNAEEVSLASGICERIPGVKGVANCLLVEQMLH